MSQKNIIIKSEGRRVFRIAIALIIGIAFFILWLQNNNLASALITGLFVFMAFIEFTAYCQTTLELTNDKLKVSRKGLSNENYEIKLKDITSSFYDKKTYDNWELYQRLFWELLFPSGQSYLIINKQDGKSKKIPFNGNEIELLNLIQQLPNRLPN